MGVVFFVVMLLAGFVIILSIIGIICLLTAIVLKIVNSRKAKKHIKSRALSVVSIVFLIVGILFLIPMIFIIGFSVFGNIA